jgi:response regulator of citrate/malate metabolism
VPDEISWGEEPSWQQPASTIVDNTNTLLVEALQKQLQEAETTQAKLAEDLRVSQVRCGKALKQLKSIKEQKQPTAAPAQSDLSRVIEEELQVCC